jgi:hypothetical protein
MALPKEDRIYLAYKNIRTKIKREGLDREHARAVLYIAEAFGISVLTVQKIVDTKK